MLASRPIGAQKSAEGEVVVICSHLLSIQDQIKEIKVTEKSPATLANRNGVDLSDKSASNLGGL
jgi:hypothetical protein